MSGPGGFGKVGFGSQKRGNANGFGASPRQLVPAWEKETWKKVFISFSSLLFLHVCTWEKKRSWMLHHCRLVWWEMRGRAAILGFFFRNDHQGVVSPPPQKHDTIPKFSSVCKFLIVVRGGIKSSLKIGKCYSFATLVFPLYTPRDILARIFFFSSIREFVVSDEKKYQEFSGEKGNWTILVRHPWVFVQGWTLKSKRQWAT